MQMIADSLHFCQYRCYRCVALRRFMHAYSCGSCFLSALPPFQARPGVMCFGMRRMDAVKVFGQFCSRSAAASTAAAAAIASDGSCQEIAMARGPVFILKVDMRIWMYFFISSSCERCTSGANHT